MFVIWFLFCNVYYIQSQNLRNPRCMWMGVKYYHLILIHRTFHVLFTCHGLVYANYLRCHLFMRLKSTIQADIYFLHIYSIFIRSSETPFSLSHNCTITFISPSYYNIQVTFLTIFYFTSTYPACEIYRNH